jgi:hypothetical protein
MKQNYLLNEKDSYQSFAVIKDIDTTNISLSNIDLINKVGLAIEENNQMEERVKIIHDSIIFPDKFGTQIFYMAFRGIDKDDEEVIIEVELNQVAIY